MEKLNFYFDCDFLWRVKIFGSKLREARGLLSKEEVMIALPLWISEVVYTRWEQSESEPSRRDQETVLSIVRQLAEDRKDCLDPGQLEWRKTDSELAHLHSLNLGRVKRLRRLYSPISRIVRDRTLAELRRKLVEFADWSKTDVQLQKEFSAPKNVVRTLRLVVAKDTLPLKKGSRSHKRETV